jgi:hypothetical protein
MAIFPCNQKGLCIDPANPFQNLSAELPDQPVFIARSTGFGPMYPPLGSDFTAVGCTTFCESTVSQQEADRCAARQWVDCLSTEWPVGRPTVDVFGNPVTAESPRPVFHSRAQSVTVACPDGNPFTYNVPAGRYSAFSQAAADEAAFSDAMENAPLFIVCISDLSQPRGCANQDYNASVTATGGHLTNSNVVWAIIGSLPDGIETDIDVLDTGFTGSKTLNFFGTPTTPGDYAFAIRCQDAIGDFMVKPVTISVMGITNGDSLDDATVGTAYMEDVESAGVTNPIYSVEDGSLPDGLTMDFAGQIRGTPTMSGTFDFVLGVTEAGTGITCNQNASIEVLSGQCAVLPTQTRNLNLVDNFDSIAFARGGNLALLGTGFTPRLSLYDVKNGGFVLQTSITPTNGAGNLTQGRVVWSPLANEWVYLAVDVATGTQAWFTSYNKTTLAQTGQKQGVAVGGQQDPWALICSATTGIVYGSITLGDIQSYNSVTHNIVASTGLPAPYSFFGSLGLDETGGTLYAAAGANDPFVAGPAGLFYLNPTTLALKPGINPMPLPNATGRGLVVACVFNPDNGRVYVAGNDGGGDGGDVVWVVNPATQTVVATIRMVAAMWDQANIVAAAVPQTLIYDAATHQIYIFAANATVSARIHVVCCDTNTRVGSFPLAADADYGDVVFADIHDTVPVQTTNTILSVNAFGGAAFAGQLLGYTFP